MQDSSNCSISFADEVFCEWMFRILLILDGDFVCCGGIVSAGIWHFDKVVGYCLNYYRVRNLIVVGGIYTMEQFSKYTAGYENGNSQ